MSNPEDKRDIVAENAKAVWEEEAHAEADAGAAWEAGNNPSDIPLAATVDGADLPGQRRSSFIGRTLSGGYLKRDSMFTFKRSESDFFKGSPSVPPPSGMTEIVLRAPTETRFLVLGLLVAVTVFIAFYWSSLGVVNQKLVLVANLLVLVGTVDYFQKKYVFKGDQVARRILFRWKRYQLPPSFTVSREPSGAIVISDDHDDGVIMAIGRDMVNEQMARALKEMYQYASEDSFEVG